MKGNSVLFAAVLVCAILGAAVGGVVSFAGSYRIGKANVERLQAKEAELIALIQRRGGDSSSVETKDRSGWDYMPDRASTDAASAAFLGGVAGACLGLVSGFGAKVIF